MMQLFQKKNDLKLPILSLKQCNATQIEIRNQPVNRNPSNPKQKLSRKKDPSKFWTEVNQ